MKVRTIKVVLYNIRARCNNPSHPQYKDYGGRGIKVCNEWNDSDVFLKWALESGYAPNLTIDRINVNGDYAPGNCRWIPKGDQQFNKRNNTYLTYNNETKCLAEWAHQLGIHKTTLRDRLKHMTVEQALSMPKQRSGRPSKIQEILKNL